jgi:hypothetical protein
MFNNGILTQQNLLLFSNLKLSLHEDLSVTGCCVISTTYVTADVSGKRSASSPCRVRTVVKSANCLHICPSVRPSVHMYHMYVKFYIRDFYETLSRSLTFV